MPRRRKPDAPVVPKRTKGPGACEQCGVPLSRQGNSFYARLCKTHSNQSRKGMNPVTPEQRAKGHETIRAAMKLYREVQSGLQSQGKAV